MKIFFDCETTGKNPYQDEVITMFMQDEHGNEHLMESQVDNWKEDAVHIHGITFPQMLTFSNKKDAWDSVIKFIGDAEEIELICYANPQTELGYLLFDVVLFKMHMLEHLNLDRENHLPWKIKSQSVHSLAKECHRNSLFEPFRNLATGRHSFTQENVYMALFSANYDAHDARVDVKAMIKIYNKLTQLKESKTVNSGQTSLL